MVASCVFVKTCLPRLPVHQFTGCRAVFVSCWISVHLSAACFELYGLCVLAFWSTPLTLSLAHRTPCCPLFLAYTVNLFRSISLSYVCFSDYFSLPHDLCLTRFVSLCFACVFCHFSPTRSLAHSSSLLPTSTSRVVGSLAHSVALFLCCPFG